MFYIHTYFICHAGQYKKAAKKLMSNYFVISNYLFVERSDYLVERSDYFLEQSDHKMERSDLERSDRIPP